MDITPGQIKTLGVPVKKSPGFAQDINFTVAAPLTGISVTITPSSSPGSEGDTSINVQISVDPSATPGSRTLVLTGTPAPNTDLSIGLNVVSSVGVSSNTSSGGLAVSFTEDPTFSRGGSGTNPLQVSFTPHYFGPAGELSVPISVVRAVSWNFGAGAAPATSNSVGNNTVSNGAVFPGPGTYTVTLTALGRDGQVASAKRQVTLSASGQGTTSVGLLGVTLTDLGPVSASDVFTRRIRATVTGASGSLRGGWTWNYGRYDVSTESFSGQASVIEVVHSFPAEFGPDNLPAQGQLLFNVADDAGNTGHARGNTAIAFTAVDLQVAAQHIGGRRYYFALTTPSAPDASGTVILTASDGSGDTQGWAHAAAAQAANYDNNYKISSHFSHIFPAGNQYMQLKLLTTKGLYANKTVNVNVAPEAAPSFTVDSTLQLWYGQYSAVARFANYLSMTPNVSVVPFWFDSAGTPIDFNTSGQIAYDSTSNFGLGTAICSISETARAGRTSLKVSFEITPAGGIPQGTPNTPRFTVNMP